MVRFFAVIPYCYLVNCRHNLDTVTMSVNQPISPTNLIARYHQALELI